MPDGFTEPKAFRARYDELAALDAAQKSRELSLPNDYKAELPTDFKPPDGVNFELKADDPLMAQAKTLAKEAKLTQDQFSKFLGLYAGAQVANQQLIKQAFDREVAKLGANGPARIDAITTWLGAMGGADAGALIHVLRLAPVASTVTALERLMQKVNSQGGVSYRGNGREPPDQPGRLSQEQISKLTAAERLDYSRRFDQSKMPAWQDPRGR